MSIFLDQKYLMLMSNRLPLFKKKADLRRNGFHETDEKTGWPGILISGERV